MPVTRLVTEDDAPVLAELLRVNRDFLVPWEPIRDDASYTVAGQRATRPERPHLSDTTPGR